MNTVGTVPGNLQKVSKMYWACRATQALNAWSWTWALPRTPGLSLQAPGVSRWKGPPGPNLRSAKASTAAAMSRWCGGQ